jgi:hypothetical protein
MKATTSPFRVMAEVFPLRHSAGNCACPLVMVNVFFMQILHRPFFIFRQVFLTAQERGQCRIKRTLDGEFYFRPGQIGRAFCCRQAAFSRCFPGNKKARREAEAARWPSLESCEPAPVGGV